MSIRLLSPRVVVVACFASSGLWMPSLAAAQARADIPSNIQERLVTAAGCLTRQTSAPVAPIAGHESESADGLALTKATLVDAAPASDRTTAPSAVPGSRPAGAGSETVARQQPPSSAPTSTEERAFWIVGSHRAELTRYIGKHGQVTGTLQTPPASAERTTPAVGTTGTRAGDTRTETARPGTRAETGESRVAHPSAPTHTIWLETSSAT